MHEVLVIRLVQLALEKVWLGELTHLKMTIAVDWGMKPQTNQTNKNNRPLAWLDTLLCLNVPPIDKVILGRGHSLKSLPTDWRSWGSIHQFLVYKASCLSTTPQLFLPGWICKHGHLTLCGPETPKWVLW